MPGTGADRLGPAVAILLRHLGLALRETAPSPAEWRAAADFLAEAGQYSDERRQEVVLLSDVLGVTALVEAMADRLPPGATPATLPDPFYVPGAPLRADGADLCVAGEGEALAVEGRVTDLAGAPLPGALVEVWQANAEGRHDNQDPDRQPEHNLRGTFRADAGGGFRFRTIRPGAIRLPCDGPVGRLLARLGRPALTPGHLSFRVSAPGHRTLRTQIFDAADPALAEDAVFAVRAGLALPFLPASGGRRVAPVFALAPRAGGAA